jgi:Mor family transcriptional regulator
LDDLSESLESVLVAHGIPAEVAARAAWQSALDLRDQYAGDFIKFPKCAQRLLDERDAAMWRAFNGRNHAALAQAHDLGVKEVYRILRRISLSLRSQTPPPRHPC